MKINIVNNDSSSNVKGIVVAIDVVRAFTTAAFALQAGASQILLAGPVDEAFSLKDRFPGSLLMGEVYGMRVEGFDFWNSPAQFDGLDLSGKTIVQRTSAGTQGIVQSKAADRLFAASFVVAGATARALNSLQPEQVTFIATGETNRDTRHGVEDRICADYIIALMRGEQPDPNNYMKWLDTFADDRLPDASDDVRNSFLEDLKLCAQVDRFDFALRVERRDELFVMEKYP